MKFQQEMQQLLLEHSLPSSSHSVLAYLESYLLTALTNVLKELRYTSRRLSLLPSTGTSPSPPVPYDLLLLYIHLHDKPRFYRLSMYLTWEEVRKKAKTSAYGVSELEMPNEDDDPDKDPEDAWVSSEATTGSAATGPAGGGSGLLTYDSISLFEEYALPKEDPSADNPEAELQRMAATPGLIEHFKRLKAADLVTADISPSDYVQYAENRVQASFSHHKARTKRFKEFISPTLLFMDIPANDEFVDTLGFLAFEIVTDLILKAREQAHKRIKSMREAEDRVRNMQRKRLALSERKNAFKKKKIDLSSSKGSPRKDSKSDKSLNAEKKSSEDLLKRQEENLIPTGPFSAAPLIQNVGGSALPCPGKVDPPLAGAASNGGPAGEMTKVDSPTPMGDVASVYDVLLGDFEEALHSQVRQGRMKTFHQRRGMRVMERFR